MIVFDRLVVAGDLRFDRLVDIASAPFIESITGAQDGQPLTITGTSFSATGNRVFIGIPDDEENTPLELVVDTEGTTEIVTEALDASAFYLSLPISVFVRDDSDVASNAVSVVVVPATGEFARLIDQEFLGDASTRIEADPPLTLGDEVRWDSADVTVTGQGAFSADDSVAAFNVAVFDGELLGEWGEQTLEDPVTTAEVPDVTGLTQAAATTAIENVALTVSVLPVVPSATVAAGLVITQFPPATTDLTIGGVVELTISEGLVAGLVPNLAAFGITDVIALLESVGLELGAVTYISGGTGNPSVANQSIAPGETRPVGSTVDVEFYIGDAGNVSVPDVDDSGTTQAEALEAILLAYLLSDVETEYSATIPSGEVISQSPAAATSVAPGSTVTLTVSLGVEPVALGGGFDFGFGFGFAYGAGSGGGAPAETIWDDIWEDIWGDIWAVPA